MKCGATGKDCYRNETLAKAAMARMRARFRRHKPSRVYRCPFCDEWHLTSQTRRK